MRALRAPCRFGPIGGIALVIDAWRVCDECRHRHYTVVGGWRGGRGLKGVRDAFGEPLQCVGVKSGDDIADAGPVCGYR